MPTYEYECLNCGHRFELFQQMTDKPAGDCPRCKGRVRRLIGTGGGIVIKAGGNSRGADGACPLEKTGRTCCGRETRCNAPAGEGAALRIK